MLVNNSSTVHPRVLRFLSWLSSCALAQHSSYPHKEFLNLRPPRTCSKYSLPRPTASSTRTQSSAGFRTCPTNADTCNPRGFTCPTQDSSTRNLCELNCPTQDSNMQRTMWPTLHINGYVLIRTSHSLSCNGQVLVRTSHSSLMQQTSQSNNSASQNESKWKVQWHKPWMVAFSQYRSCNEPE